MKEIFIYIDDEGYFTCNTGITVDMWKTFLRDGKLMTPDRIDMLVGENGAFPPTRNGCIHSLSMRERG